MIKKFFFNINNEKLFHSQINYLLNVLLKRWNTEHDTQLSLSAKFPVIIKREKQRDIKPRYFTRY